MKKRWVQGVGIFFAVMLIFTLLSRAADSVNVIRVQVKNPGNQMVTHKVSGTGKVEGSAEEAVFVQENLKIQQVMVHAGQTVKKGDVLLSLSEESIQDAIKDVQDKILTLEGQIKDLKSQENVKRQSRAIEQAFAGNSYDLAVQSGNISVDNAQAEVQIARERLDAYYAQKEAAAEQNEADGFTDGGIRTVDSGMDGFSDAPSGETEETDGNTAQNGSAQTEDTATEQALQDDLRAKQEALNAAIAGRNQGLSSAEREIASANIAQASDSSLENVSRELENRKEDLEKLTELQSAAGNITSPSDGVIKNLSVQTGEITGQTAAAVLYPSAGTTYLTGTVSKEDLKYISAGMDVEIKDYNDNDISGATVESVTENNQNNDQETDNRDLRILLPADSLSIGDLASFSLSKDAGPYSCCVPLSALYEEDGKNYVYVTETQNTVLGSVMVARKLEVTVKDKNQSVAALDEGSISTDQQVIVETDRELTDGCRVRLEDA